MSKILLVAINACYNHTNLAVRTINEYIDKKNLVSFDEWTINQPVGDILRGIVEKEPALVIFSTYIWNAEITQKVICDLKKILPEVVIGSGGPEIGFCADYYLKKIEALDFVIYGEGEATSKELVDLFEKVQGDGKKFVQNLESVKGLFIRKDGKATFTGERPLICNLDEIPFAYPQITDPDNRIYYYESSRGCPFTCAYCMSSIDKKVRFTSLERTFKDIQRFLDVNVRLVKFVDRTYNLGEDRYIAIWEYILKHHNKKTMFHFEIEAEFLSEKALDFLQKVPKGVMQFEIGVQSSNKQTLESVGRSPNIEKLAANIRRIPKTIHSHLDLIAGLPHEDLETFGKSFDFVMDLRPDALQLGFLKVLHGTKMESYSEKNGWVWMEHPPYETLSTPYLSYKDIIFLKDVEKLLDAYWNSGSFITVMEYIFSKTSPWNFFYKLVCISRAKEVFIQPRKEQFWFELLAQILFDKEFSEINSETATELLRFDFIKSGKKGGFPLWYEHRYNKDNHRLALEQNGGIDNSRIGFAHSDYEEFNINPLEKETWENKSENKNPCKMLLIYPRRDNPEQDYKQVILKI